MTGAYPGNSRGLLIETGRRVIPEVLIEVDIRVGTALMHVSGGWRCNNDIIDNHHPREMTLARQSLCLLSGWS